MIPSQPERELPSGQPSGQPESENPLDRPLAAFPAGNRFTALIMQGQALLKQGETITAEKTLHTALDFARKNFEKGHINEARALEDYAHCCLINQKDGLAERAYLELVEIAEMNPERLAPQATASAINLALIKLAAEEYDTAQYWAGNAVERAEKNPELNQWLPPGRLALGLVLQLKGDTAASAAQLDLAFYALEAEEGTSIPNTVARQLTRLSSVFADKLEFSKALSCLDAISKLVQGNDGQSQHLRLAAMEERARIQARMGKIGESYETERTYLENANQMGFKPRSLFLKQMSLARKLIELGNFEVGERLLHQLYEQGRQNGTSSHLLIAIRCHLARSEYSRGAVAQAQRTNDWTIAEIFKSLPEPISTLIQDRPEAITSELPEAVMKKRAGKQPREIIKDLDQLVPLIALRWHIARHNADHETSPQDLHTCHSLIEVLRKEGAAGNLEYFKMIFIDNLGTGDRLEKLEELLKEKQRSNSREELNLRIAAAIESHQLGFEAISEAHMERAAFLYDRLIEFSDSLQLTEMSIFYASAQAEFGQIELAISALQRSYTLLENSPILEGPEYLELLDQLAARCATYDADLAERYANEASAMRRRLTLKNPGFTFDQE